jgi:hypothetical protein
VAESLLMSVTRLWTFLGDRALTAGSGFFYESKSRLYLVTSRHVFIDEAARCCDRGEQDRGPFRPPLGLDGAWYSDVLNTLVP